MRDIEHAKDIAYALATVFRKRMAESKLTITSLSNKSKISRSRVKKIVRIRPKGFPHINTIVAFSKVFGCNVSTLFMEAEKLVEQWENETDVFT